MPFHARAVRATLPAALTHGFKGGFIVSAFICAAAAVCALALLPGRKRERDSEEIETITLAFARCPGAPYCGALTRLVAFGRRIRGNTPREGTSS